MRNETRFRMVEKIDPERFKQLALMAAQQAHVSVRRLPAARRAHGSPVTDAEAEAEPAAAKK